MRFGALYKFEFGFVGADFRLNYSCIVHMFDDDAECKNNRHVSCREYSREWSYVSRMIKLIFFRFGINLFELNE